MTRKGKRVLACGAGETLCDGMARTYHWIKREMTQSSRLLSRTGILECYATA